VPSSPPNSRPTSSLPRRTSNARGPYLTSHRPGHSPRGSSISLVSSDSSISLLASSKRANGSALKHSTTVNDNAPEPTELLEKILGPTAKGTVKGEEEDRSITEDDLDIEFDFGGQSLRELAQVDNAQDLGSFHRYQSVEECTCCILFFHPTSMLVLTVSYLDEAEKTKFEELHRSIQACDDILGSVEANLTNFRNDLATVSEHIESLQIRSSGLNVRLENRKAVEKVLGPVVEELSISPLVVSKISEGHIDEAWVKVLAEVDKRSVAHKRNQEQMQCKAMSDLGPLLDKLIMKVRWDRRGF
jgi:hypothetical protein